MHYLHHHPDILLIHEIMGTRTKIYLIVDFIGGNELFFKISRHGRLLEPAARRHFQQLISALCFCHCNGIAHHNLKPHLPLNTAGNLKVFDFGVFALLDQLKNGLLHTAFYTPAYTVLEILYRCHGSNNGAKANTWSCGLILYVLLVGHLLFDDSDIAASKDQPMGVQLQELNTPKQG